MSRPVSFSGIRPEYTHAQMESLANWDTLSSPTDGQVLTYDTTTSKWKPTSVSDGDMGTFTGSTIPDNSTTKESLQAIETSMEAPNGGTPIVSRHAYEYLNNLNPATQGILTQRGQNLGGLVRPSTLWYFYDYTGTGQHNETSKTGIVGLFENVPGSYTLKARAWWPFGTSDERTISVTINAFTLTQDTMFGGVDGFQTKFNWNTPGRSYHNIATQGAVVDNAGTYTWDDGSLVADTANCVGFWDYTNNVLVAFRYNSSGTLESSHVWDGVSGASVQPAQGVTFSNGGTQTTTTAAHNTAMNAFSVSSKRVAIGVLTSFSLGSKYYLELTPSGSEFDNFGSSGTDWSYGFVLADDWISSRTSPQMLSPSDTAQAFAGGIAAFDQSGTAKEYITYGNSSNGPYWTETNSATWDISATAWLIGTAGDLVVVTFDGTSKDWKVYVEGTLIVDSQNVKDYMQATTTPTSLRLGDISAFDITDYEDSSMSGWYARLDNIFVANGTAFSQAQVTEMTVDKADLTTSDNYGDFTTYATFVGSITSVKGSATYTRGDHSSNFSVGFRTGSNFL